MTVTLTPVYLGPTLAVWDVESTDAADVVTLDPGWGVDPLIVTLDPLTDEFYDSHWLMTFPGGGVVELRHGLPAGGAAGDQLRAVLQLPHSLMR